MRKGGGHGWLTLSALLLYRVTTFWFCAKEKTLETPQYWILKLKSELCKSVFCRASKSVIFRVFGILQNSPVVSAGYWNPYRTVPKYR